MSKFYLMKMTCFYSFKENTGVIMKYGLTALSLAALLSLSACSEDEENPFAAIPSTPSTTPTENNAQCSFNKADNVWKFSYASFTDTYTWVDDTTVKFEEAMNGYVMESSAKTFTDQNRDEFYERAMSECNRMTSDD